MKYTRLSKIRIACMAFGVVAFGRPAIALPLFVDSFAAVETCLGPTYNAGCELGHETDFVSLGTVAVDGSYGSGDATMTASSSAALIRGMVMGSTSSVSFDITGTPQIALSVANVEYIDIVTISFGPWNGATGSLLLSYTLDGTVTQQGDATASSLVTVVLGSEETMFTPSAQIWETQYFESVSGIFSRRFSFVFGEPFGLQFHLATGAGFDGPFVVSGVGEGSASASFFNTLILSGLVPFDPDGNPVTGATFSSGSGTVYTTNGVVTEPSTVPEPASLSLLGLGLAGVAVRRFRKRR